MQDRKTSPLYAPCALLALMATCAFLAPPAKAGADLSTPKKAALVFTKAIESGDMDAVKASSVGTDDDYATLKSLSSMVGSMKRMQAALVKKFGDDAKQIPDMSATMSSQMETAEEKIDGDSATLVVKNKPDDKHPPTLKKTGDDWKMDLKSMSSDPDFAKLKDTAVKAVPLIDEYTKDVESGKYATFAEAAQGLFQTMSKLAPAPEK